MIVHFFDGCVIEKKVERTSKMKEVSTAHEARRQAVDKIRIIR